MNMLQYLYHYSITTYKFPFSLLHAEGADTERIIITLLHASLIPLIISTNLLFVFGIIKRQNEINLLRLKYCF